MSRSCFSLQRGGSGRDARRFGGSCPQWGLQNGDLTGWTMFRTTNGTIGTPARCSLRDDRFWRIERRGNEQSARIDHEFYVPQGGGIYQSVKTAAGSFNVSAYIAARAPSSANLSCGMFELLVDGLSSTATTSGLPTTSRSARQIRPSAPPERGGAGLSAGSHEVRIRIGRWFTTSAQTPREYVDNVSLTLVTAAMPTTKDQCKKDD